MARKKILIANRGEIALRIIRTAREQGYATVAVYSEVDQSALHVRFADEAYCIGPPPPAESYLQIDKIVDVAKKAGAFAIHPGYGFLSENAEFAKAVEKAKLTFIGPPSKAMAAMGDKLEARSWAKKTNLRVTPASETLKNAADAKKAAVKVKYPVLLKARAGGGGKGMRRVRSAAEMDEAFRLAQSEAKKSFKSDELYLERYVERPRHIEVQLFADTHGRVVALGDRECSIQRRHQKIIEEAPAPNLKEHTRKQMADAACAIAKAVGYEGAGTVEFLVDHKEDFYFLEMNTRLQVEHPVTEWVTGLDLVALQFLVAEGEPLPISRNVAILGHAIEARLYAEDPDNHFFPSPGTVSYLQWAAGPGTRIDSGVETGSEISLFYDPLIAKISVWGETRKDAVARMQRVLAETRVGGIKTNLRFLRAIARHPKFVAGRVSTTFIQEEGPFASPDPLANTIDASIAAIRLLTATSARKPPDSIVEASAWWKSGLPKRAVPR